MEILKFLGAATYGFLLSYFLWVGFFCATPFIFDTIRGYPWTYLFCSFVFMVLFALLATFLAKPLAIMSSKIVSKVLPIIALLYFGYEAATLPWQLGAHLGGIFYFILGVVIDFWVVIAYGLFLIFVIKGIHSENPTSR